MKEIIEALESKIKDCENAISHGADQTSNAMKFAYEESLELIKRKQTEEYCDRMGICPDCQSIVEGCWCE